MAKTPILILALPVLSWLLVAAMVGLLALAFAMGLGASYHPHADGSHLVAPRIFVASVAVLVAAGLAVWMTAGRHVVPARVMVLAMAGHVVSVGAAWALVGVVMPAQPDAVHSFVGQTAYAVPRHYAPAGARDPGASGTLSVTICAATAAPQYAGRCPDRPGRPSYRTTLMTIEPMGSWFEVHFPLDELGVPREADVIGPLPAGVAITPVAVGGLAGFTARVSGSDHMFLMDDDGLLVLHADCDARYGQCAVMIRMPDAAYRFEVDGGEAMDLERWRREAAEWAALFGSWRCAEASCGGRF